MDVIPMRKIAALNVEGTRRKTSTRCYTLLRLMKEGILAVP
jgi:hypothetical protein